MDDRNLVLGVLATQAGFVTPAQVMAAASARMLARDGRSVLDHLVESGALTPERRDLILGVANEALTANGGSPERVLDSLPGARALSRTLDSALLPDASAPADGTDIIPVEPEGKYARFEELGRGGQSIVWRAVDRFVGREVALKELTLPGNGDSPSAGAARARFLREARLTAQLDHPGIVAVHELAERPDGTLYAAQKLVRGRTLKTALAQCRTLGQRLELLPHLVDAAQAVAYAHARTVVHRDLKPSNVMVGPYGETVVVDWGLAKRRGEAEPGPAGPGSPSTPELTQTGVALGTPSYMSPEQARGDVQAIDERSDVFSLGAMLYELLTGRPPFQGADNAQVIGAVLSGNLTPIQELCPEAPPELVAIAERALRSDRALRYVDAGAFASELLVYQAGGRVEAYAYRPLELARKFVRRNRALSAALAASALILVGGVVAVVMQLRQARVNLGSALIERARRAEDVSDWARAAAYYAASRVQNDTAAARWGLSLSREKMPQRASVLTGAPGAFTDVEVLADGRLVALEAGKDDARVYDVASGRTLWTARSEEPITEARITSGAVRLASARSTRVLDVLTGEERFSFEGRQCRNGPPSRRARFTNKGVLQVEGAEDTRVEVDLRAPCTISPAGDRLAVKDQQGIVRLWDLETARELTSRPAPDAQEIAFTAHGVALVRSGSLQLFGGAEGDFSLELPGRSGSGFAVTSTGRVIEVSPDGHRVVVDSPTLNRADVVDLPERTVFVSVSRPPGVPRYAFSPDGSRLYAAKLSGGRALFAWDLHRPVPTASGSFGPRLYFRGGRARFLLVENWKRVELRSEEGNLLRTITDPEVADAFISKDGSRLALTRRPDVVIQSADDARELARLPCEKCYNVVLSPDGSRVLTLSSQRRRLWDVRGPSILLDEPMGTVQRTDWHAMAPDGERIAWVEGDGLVVQQVSTRSRSHLHLPDRPETIDISPDGTRVAMYVPGRIAVWRLPGFEPVWSTPNPVSVGSTVGWSADGSIVTVSHEGAGAVLLDGRTGAELARIVEGPSGAGLSQVNVFPTLRYRLTRGAHAWAVFPIPAADSLSPEDSLRRALADGGFRLRGVELEVVSP
ncbi:MAG TPA: WD40 repeat domain-containing serine/threonine-protein kinase [Myxococcaceae bacterium]|nr:WD40 repeat domain-containing serine/threonine-protein kinase [Myxococcaceae bacterium]